MEGSKGYYSLIQYCPDQSRLEVANVGVLLFCPELRFLKTLMAKGNDRVRTIFKMSGNDLIRVETAKQAIAERVGIESNAFPTLEELQHFIITRGNDIIMTQPRPMKVMSPEADLENLFNELVGGRKRSSQTRENQGFPEIEKAFQAADIRSRIAKDLRIMLPITEQEIIIPYAFRNGKQNLIKPQRFSSNKREAVGKASTLAFEGSLLHKQPFNGQERKLIVVSAFDDPSFSVISMVEKLFTSYDVRHLPMERIGDLAEEIRRTAH